MTRRRTHVLGHVGQRVLPPYTGSLLTLPVGVGQTLLVYRDVLCPTPLGDGPNQTHALFVSERRGWPPSQRAAAFPLPFRSVWRERVRQVSYPVVLPLPCLSPARVASPRRASAGSPTQRAMTEPVNSRTYGTLSGSSPEALEPRGRGRATAGTATAGVSVQVSGRADVASRPRQSGSVRTSAALATCRRTQDSTKGDPKASRKCSGLALPTAKKFQVGRSGGRGCAP
jgi:hypothetical protein